MSMLGKIRSMIWRAPIDAVDSSKPIQQVTLGGLLGGGRTADMLQQYGFTSVPPKGSEAIAVQSDGDAASLVVPAVDCSEFRPIGLASGEVCLWHKDGARITFKANGGILLEPKSGAEILLGDGTDPIVRKSDLQEIVTWANGHAHAGGSLVAAPDISGGSVTGTSAPPVSSLSVPACSSKVKTT